MGCPEAELSLLLTDDEEIRELNRCYRQQDKPTDVLAFAARQDEWAPYCQGFLGDVVISVETAQRQAAWVGAGRMEQVLCSSRDMPESDDAELESKSERELRSADGRSWTDLDEVSFLMIHGVLHCLGYDHGDDAEEAEMRTQEQKLMAWIRRRCPTGGGMMVGARP